MSRFYTRKRGERPEWGDGLGGEVVSMGDEFWHEGWVKEGFREFFVVSNVDVSRELILAERANRTRGWFTFASMEQGAHLVRSVRELTRR